MVQKAVIAIEVGKCVTAQLTVIADIDRNAKVLKTITAHYELVKKEKQPELAEAFERGRLDEGEIRRMEGIT